RPRGQRQHRGHPVLHLPGGEPGRLLGPRAHARTAVRPRRGRSDPAAPRRSHDLPAHRSRRVRSYRRRRACRHVHAGDHVIRILEPGPQTTIQDLGRPGHLRVGIPPSGPMDRRAFLLANRLVGNADGVAALECTVAGPRFEARASGAFAVTGGDVPVLVNDVTAPMWTTLPLAAGDLVKIGTARAGVRAYVAFAGGIDVPPVLGSRATYLRGRLGGLGGRALKRNDVLPVGVAAPAPRRRVKSTALPVLESEPA